MEKRRGQIHSHSNSVFLHVNPKRQTLEICQSNQASLYVFFLPLSPSFTLPTCVLKHKSIAAQGCVAAESQKQGVGAAFDAVWNICTVETAQQGAEGVWTIVDVQEIIAGLQTKPGNRRGRDPLEDFWSANTCYFRGKLTG